MHLLIVAPEQIPVPPARGGSVEICIWAIARRLARQINVTVVSRAHRGYPSHTVDGNLTIVRVPTGRPSVYLASVLKWAKGKHFDHIQVDNRPRFVRKLKEAFPNTPVSLFLHSLTFVSRPMIGREEAARCLPWADLIVANSDSLKRELSERFPVVADRIRQVYLGVDLNRFRPGSAEERRRLRSKHGLGGSFAVAFAGRMIPRKGIPVLLRAAAIVRRKAPGVKVLIAGGGKTGAGYRLRMQRLARQLKLPARFLGQVPHRRMHQVYRMADCFVCPSQKHEAFGLVNVEAMASGLPVVASDIGGIKEIVRHEHNGLLVRQYRSPASFAAQLLRLAQNRSWAAEMGKRGRRDAADRFGWGQTASALLALYQSKSGKGEEI